MADFININVLILDSNNKKFKGFPFKGKFSNKMSKNRKYVMKMEFVNYL